MDLTQGPVLADATGVARMVPVVAAPAAASSSSGPTAPRATGIPADATDEEEAIIEAALGRHAGEIHKM
eukprot:12883528-Prorocentrum_lima.AAC.1